MNTLIINNYHEAHQRNDNRQLGDEIIYTASVAEREEEEEEEMEQGVIKASVCQSQGEVVVDVSPGALPATLR